MSNNTAKRIFQSYGKACTAYERVQYNLFEVRSDLNRIQSMKYGQSFRGGSWLSLRIEALIDKSTELEKKLEIVGKRKDDTYDKVIELISRLKNEDWANVLHDRYIKRLPYSEIEKRRNFAYGVAKNIVCLACKKLNES